MLDNRKAFLSLIRAGAGFNVDTWPEEYDLSWVKNLADIQGLSAIVLDGVDELRNDKIPDARIDKDLLEQWIFYVLQTEAIQTAQIKTACKIASSFWKNGIKTYLLKGFIIAECYPKPNHRISCDVDCFLTPISGDFNAWEEGNSIIKEMGFVVIDDFYRHSKFLLPNVTIENHRFLTPIRGNKRLTKMEIVLQEMLKVDTGDDFIDDKRICRPPVMVSALFIIEHAYVHFLHDGITWRYVLDWVLFKKRHNRDIDWNTFNAFISEFGLERFYQSFSRIGAYLADCALENDLRPCDKMLIEDIWTVGGTSNDYRGILGKASLIKNILGSRWKYKYFSETGMFSSLCRMAMGYLFVRHPKLSNN